MEKKRFPLICENWKIDFLSEKAISEHSKGHQLIERLFQVSNEKLNEKHLVTQLHYENWPDQGIPDFLLFQQLLDEVDAKGSSHFPITVHCSAGIGRTGTFIASHTLRKEIRQKKGQGISQDLIFLNIPSMIMKLRFQRKGLIGTSEQLKTIYKIAAYEYKNEPICLFLLQKLL